MKFLAWLLMGTGTYLMWAAAKNRHPVKVMVALAKGQPAPTEQWQIAPLPPGEVGSILGRAMGDLLNQIPGNATTPNTPTGSTSPGRGQQGSPAGARSTVVNFAREQLGERYVFAARGPDQWDCSGLTLEAYKKVGINLPHNAAMQQRLGKQTHQPQPADLVFWGLTSGHVGIYVGDGMMIHAPNVRRPVSLDKVNDLSRVMYRTYL